MLEFNVKTGWIIAAVMCMGLVPEDTAAQEKPLVSIIGTGTLAGTLGPALGRNGYTVVYGSRDPARESVRETLERTGADASATGQREAAERAAIIVLAVPPEVVEEVASNLGDLNGKVVVDVSGGEKRVAPDGYLELVPDSTNSERLQSRHPGARVVRLNLPSVLFFIDPLFVGTAPTVLIAGDDPRGREAVAKIIFDLGLDPWDAGPIRFSRVFDAMAVMGLVPAQQGRDEAYELRLMPSMPLSCILDMSEMFGFGRPNDLDELPDFPRREPVIPCEEWMPLLDAAQRGEAPASPADSVRALTSELAAAWEALDADRYLGWFASDLVFYFEGARVERPELESIIRATTAGLQSSTFEISDPRVQVLGPDAAAISFGLRELMVDTAGVTTDLRAALTLVWERRPEGWRVVLAHESFS